MSLKQEVYQNMLHLALPHLRNLSSGSWWHKIRDRSAYYEAELVHNLPISMFEPVFVSHDVWFLNVQARQYFEKCSQEFSPLYNRQVENIRALFELLPDEMRAELKWGGGPRPRPRRSRGFEMCRHSTDCYPPVMKTKTTLALAATVSACLALTLWANDGAQAPISPLLQPRRSGSTSR